MRTETQNNFHESFPESNGETVSDKFWSFTPGPADALAGGTAQYEEMGLRAERH